MSRIDINKFQDIPNVGNAIEKDFILLGIKKPNELAGKDPYKMYRDLCHLTGNRLDPCVIDVFISAVRYMEGDSPKKWWEFTEERKNKLGTN